MIPSLYHHCITTIVPPLYHNYTTTVPPLDDYTTIIPPSHPHYTTTASPLYHHYIPMIPPLHPHDTTIIHHLFFHIGPHQKQRLILPCTSGSAPDRQPKKFMQKGPRDPWPTTVSRVIDFWAFDGTNAWLIPKQNINQWW